MCGIWGLFGKHHLSVGAIYNAFQRIKHRGPDCSEFFQIDMLIPMFIGFHRLSIMDRTTRGNQPFVLEEEKRTIYAQCNGEIYRYHEIIEEHNLEVKSNSDCEVIPLLFQKYGFEEMLKIISSTGSEFALMVVEVLHPDSIEATTVRLYAARDMAGVRPLYYGVHDGCVGLSSELKGLVDDHLGTPTKMFDNVSQLEFGCYFEATFTETDFEYHLRDYLTLEPELPLVSKLDEALILIHDTVIQAVVRRAEADRPMGYLLSGGFDSSLVCGIMAKHLKTSIDTYSVGMPGGSDERHALVAAEYIGSKHTHFTHSVDEFLDIIPRVVHSVETWDITTIRASAGQLMVVRDIARTTDKKVLHNGDGSDELFTGYIYLRNAPSAAESHKENQRLIQNIRYYDGQRSDRAISACGIEARTPFLDYSVIKALMRIAPELRRNFGDKKEKWLLRKAFAGLGYLPDEIIWRPKEAFSDGISSEEESWHLILQKCIADYCRTKKLTHRAEILGLHKMDRLPELVNGSWVYPEISPDQPLFQTPESYYYFYLFNQMFGPGTAQVLPHGYWVPKWSETLEPSARALSHYKKEEPQSAKVAA